MAVLKKEDKQKVAQLFEAVTHPVKLVMFTQAFECDYCKMTRELLEELADLNDKVSLEVYDFVDDVVWVQAYSVEKILDTIIVGDVDFGIRFYGVLDR